jgi:predicted RND superfamily exporter protein
MGFLLLGIAVFKMEIATDFDNILHKKHPYSIALKKANEYFGGTKNLSVLFQGDMKDPALLNQMLVYEHDLEKLAQVGSVTSIATIIREMSKALLEPDEAFYDKIPESREAVAQYLELYSMSGDPEDLEDFVDFDYRSGLMEVQFKTDQKHSIRKLKKEVDSLLARDSHPILTGGYCMIEDEMSRGMAKGQWYSLSFAFFTIVLLLSIIFKSTSAGLLGGLPLLFAVICTFGIMGWTGIQLNIVTSLLSSISIGLGVDYTIHIFWRMKKEIHSGNSMEQAIQKSIRTTGYGVTINALSVVIGFSVLLFSSFSIIRSFAFLIILSILFCLLCAIILIPALCLLMKPSFLFNNKKTKDHV